MGIQAEDHGGDYLQRVAGGQILGLEAFNRQSSPEQLAGTGHMWQCLTHAAGREEGHQVSPQESPTVTIGNKGIVASQDITVVVHINNIIGTVSKVAAHQDLTHQLLVTHQNGGFVEQAIEAHVF